MFNQLLQDFRYHKMSSKEILIRLLIDRGVASVFFYRLSSWCWNHKLQLFAIIIKQLNIFFNKSDIAYQSEIGTGLRIFHALGVVIGDCTIGENFTIYQNSTIGMNGRISESGQYSPMIGNNVTFYTGSVVAGPITIGDNVKVGANSVVLMDVPPNSLVIGHKPQIIQNNKIS